MGSLNFVHGVQVLHWGRIRSIVGRADERRFKWREHYNCAEFICIQYGGGHCCRMRKSICNPWAVLHFRSNLRISKVAFLNVLCLEACWWNGALNATVDGWLYEVLVDVYYKGEYMVYATLKYLALWCRKMYAFVLVALVCGKCSVNWYH